MLEIKLEIEPSKSSPLEIVNYLKEILSDNRKNDEIKAFAILLPDGEDSEILQHFRAVHQEGDITT